MLIQIYSLTDPDDVRRCVDLGVDRVGLAPAGQSVPAEVPWEQARELLGLLGDGVAGCALSVRTDPDEVAAMASALRPDVVHLCPPAGTLDPATQRAVRERLPRDTELMSAVAVGDASSRADALAAAEASAGVSDTLILDSVAPGIPGVGAAGIVHDWHVSAEIVAAVGDRVPVILAGGLGPANVAEAIDVVRPHGVDSYTHTSHDERRKDPDALAAFVRASREATSGVSSGG
ncbi:phosphoribosylanthranilate isomerase [Egibacter rhizosphaerae]|uniref:phosphoribosylanthranilate isomerase n=1 Tax=Egibacter rhizosphaerae TaxID=1670831 RepID=UPI0013F152EB|nr:phosphoribosylanthranilate isomerase [Egibacter rhizosphaerae]